MECASLCEWHFLFMYFVTQYIHLNHPYISRISFRNLAMETCCCSFLIKNILKFVFSTLLMLNLYVVLPTCMQLMRHPSSMSTNEWHLIASTLCPLSLPHRTVQEIRHSYTAKEIQKAHPEQILWLLVTCKTYRVMALGLLKKEDEWFWLSSVLGLPL